MDPLIAGVLGFLVGGVLGLVIGFVGEIALGGVELFELVEVVG